MLLFDSVGGKSPGGVPQSGAAAAGGRPGLMPIVMNRACSRLEKAAPRRAAGERALPAREIAGGLERSRALACATAVPRLVHMRGCVRPRCRYVPGMPIRRLCAAAILLLSLALSQPAIDAGEDPAGRYFAIH